MNVLPAPRASRQSLLRRPARSPLDDGSGTVITVPSPAREQDETNRNSWLQALLPIVGAFGFIGFVVISPSPLWIAVGVLFAVGMVASSLAMNIEQRRRQGKRVMRDRRRYFAALAEVRTDVREASAKQWAAGLRCDPPPRLLQSVARNPARLWERRPRHPDFLAVRTGVGPARLRAEVKAPPESPGGTLSDPVCGFELRRVLDSIGHVEEAPLRLHLGHSRWTTFDGDPRMTRDALRAVLAQAVTWHGPDDLRLMVACSAQHLEHWRWTRWLPHQRWCESDLPDGSLILTDPEILHATLIHLVSSRRSVVESAGRTRLAPGEEATYPGPHLLVVLDEVAMEEESEALTQLRETRGLGITVLQVHGDAPRWDAPWADQIVTVDTDGLLRRAPDLVSGTSTPSRADLLDTATCEALARRLSPWRIPGHSLSDAVRSPDVGELLGVDDPGAVDGDALWAHASARGHLAVPIGSAPDGVPVTLDLKESARGGMGPHGLLVGATGSGKSELLRTLVVGLALSHPPELVSLVLVDFKGGATFAGLAGLPHVSGMITNLEDQLHLVDRMREALEGEVARRQQLLSDAGNLDGTRDYRRLREGSRPDLPPLPDLVVIVDEFSELIVARPDFIDTFVAIGRIGRSLGIHLLLASQRVDDGKLRGLDSHISYRIALRTFSTSDSASAIGSPDAYYLPPAAGSGILKVGSSLTQRFRAAHVSARYVAPSAGRRSRLVSVFDPTAQPLSLVDRTPTEGQRDDADGDGRRAATVASVIVDRLHDDARRTRPTWLPPLETTLTLDQGLGELVDHPDRGTVAVDWPHVGRLRAPFAVVDRPRDQQMAPWAPDLSGSTGSVLVVGGPMSGKSTLLKSMLLALALTHTPTEVQAYCVDLGGGSLAELERLPHVGGVAGRAQAEKITRTLEQVRAVITTREQLFATQGISSMEDYRHRRRGGELPDQVLGDVFLVVDGYGELRKSHEELDEVVTEIAARGAGFGVHVVVSVNRSMEVRPALRDSLGGRVELRISDPADSVVDRRRATAVPPGVPGRGLASDGSSMQVLLPFLAQETSSVGLISRVARAWHGPEAPPVRVLPSRLDLSELPPPTPDEPAGVPIGVEERGLGAYYLDLGTDPHFTVLGDSESGKTTVLTSYLRGLTGRTKPETTTVYVIDYRLTLLDVVPAEYLAGYASSSTSSEAVVAEIVERLADRQPRPGLSRSALHEREWWSGPEIYLVVDDYDLVAAGFDNLLAPLSANLAQGHDLGFHLVAARKTGNAARALADPVLGRMKEFGNPGLLLSGDRSEGTLLGGQRPVLRPPGRGVLVSRRNAPLLIQVAAHDIDATSRAEGT